MKAPVTKMVSELAGHRTSLSKVTDDIIKAHVDAKANNDRATTLLGDEKKSKAEADAAVAVLHDLQKRTTTIRVDKEDNFPPLPKEAMDIKA